MTFGEPLWLFGLVVFPVLVGLIWYIDRRRQKRLEKLAAARLLPELAGSVARFGRLIKRLLFLGALACFLMALARPQFGFVEEDFTTRGRDIVLAIDTSKSMLSTDVVPNRLARAKFAAQDIVDAMSGNRIALVAFAGASQVEAPLTLDYQTVMDAVNQLSTMTVERGGTNITSAIRSAELVLGKSEDSYRALVLLTDGEDLEEDSVAAARESARAGIRIFTVGIGNPEGSFIPVAPGRDQYLRDRNGQVVRSRLDERRLKDIAQQTGGFYVHLDNGAIARLIKDGLQKLTEKNIDQRPVRVPIERYRWPLLLGLTLIFVSASLSDRRREVAEKRLPLKTQSP
jgi:Ca-activated chloride channel family protein